VETALIMAPATSIIEAALSTMPPCPADKPSDVFVCCNSAPALESLELEAAPMATSVAPVASAALVAPTPTAPTPAAGGVTLFVYGWHNVQPGPLWWVFPSLRAALEAVRAMRNAVKWCVVAGEEFIGLEAARAKGAVLVEQYG
jgi:hypothetical protein